MVTSGAFLLVGRRQSPVGSSTKKDLLTAYCQLPPTGDWRLATDFSLNLQPLRPLRRTPKINTLWDAYLK